MLAGQTLRLSSPRTIFECIADNKAERTTMIVEEVLITMRANREPRELASNGVDLRGTPLPACLAGSKVLLVERVAHSVSFSRSIAETFEEFCYHDVS